MQRPHEQTVRTWGWECVALCPSLTSTLQSLLLCIQSLLLSPRLIIPSYLAQDSAPVFQLPSQKCLHSSIPQSLQCLLAFRFLHLGLTAQSLVTGRNNKKHITAKPWQQWNKHIGLSSGSQISCWNTLFFINFCIYHLVGPMPVLANSSMSNRIKPRAKSETHTTLNLFTLNHYYMSQANLPTKYLLVLFYSTASHTK